MKKFGLAFFILLMVLAVAGCGKISGLEGKVVDGKGKPMANVKIIAKQVQPIKGYEQFEATTGSDGAFSFKKLFPTSEYILFPWFDDWSSAPQRTLKYEANKLTARFNKEGWITEAKMKVQSGPEGQTIVLKSPIAILPSAPNPEFHGIYVLDNEKLTELGNRTPEENRRNFNADLSIVIFDRAIDKTVKKLEDIISLKKRSFIRCECDSVYNRENGNRIQLNIIPLYRYKLGKKIDFRLKPINDEPEMVVVVPSKPLEPGLYSLIFDEKDFPFAVGVGDILEAYSPLNNCIDLYYSSIDKDALGKSFNWSTFASQTYASKGKTSKGNSITESSYKPCNILNERIGKWKANAIKLIEQKEWLSAMKVLGQVLIVTPNSTDIMNLFKETENAYVDDSKATAIKLMKQKEWSSAMKVLKRVLIVTPNNTDVTNLYKEAQNAHGKKLRLEKERKESAIAAEIAKARVIIISALTSGKAFFGEEVTTDSKTYPFKICFTSFNDTSHLEGEMEYYAKDDRAILKFDGKLIGGTLVIKHTGTIRKGGSKPLFTYTLNLINDDYMSGRFKKSGRTSKTDKVWIDLNEKNRMAQERRYKLQENRYALIEQSITPTKTIAIAEYYGGVSSKGTVTLTNVNCKISYKLWNSLQEKEMFFYEINSIEKSQHLYGPSITVKDKKRRSLSIKFHRKKESERDAFYDKLTSTFEAWKIKYADILNE